MKEEVHHITAPTRKRVLLDTGVLISFFGRENDKERTDKAKKLILYLQEQNFEILYSQRTQNELMKKPSLTCTEFLTRTEFLKKCTLARYYSGNENWEEIDCPWENIYSPWNGSKEESEIAARIEIWLKKEKDLYDRGILLDAILNGCSYFIHENPKDFDKISIEFWKEFKLSNINLLKVDEKEIDKIFNTKDLVEMVTKD